jgi:hypothetical protein
LLLSDRAHLQCSGPIDNQPTIISPSLNAWTNAPIVLLETTQLLAYIKLLPRKPIELPAAVARSFVKDMRAFYAEPNPINRDEITSNAFPLSAL